MSMLVSISGVGIQHGNGHSGIKKQRIQVYLHPLKSSEFIGVCRIHEYASHMKNVSQWDIPFSGSLQVSTSNGIAWAKA